MKCEFSTFSTILVFVKAENAGGKRDAPPFMGNQNMLSRFSTYGCCMKNDATFLWVFLDSPVT